MSRPYRDMFTPNPLYGSSKNGRTSVPPLHYYFQAQKGAINQQTGGAVAQGPSRYLKQARPRVGLNYSAFKPQAQGQASAPIKKHPAPYPYAGQQPQQAQAPQQASAPYYNNQSYYQKPQVVCSNNSCRLVYN